MFVTSSSVAERESKAPSLSTWGQGVLLLLVTIGAYFQTWIDIWPYWENKNATYTHGTLVALVAVWLAWRARKTVNMISPVPSPSVVPLVMLLSVAWLLAEKANLFIVYATLWPVLAFVGLWAGLGLQAASRFAFPLSFLYFAIPIWDYLKPPLQAITSTMAGLLTNAFGIPAVFDGPYVTLPTATIFIAEDCSGAHFLCVALAVGVLAGVLRGDVLRTRILILAVAGLLSMAFNWLRIFLIVLAYLHPSLKEGLETMGHLTFGWWVFALDLVVFSLVLRFVPRSTTEQADHTPEPLTSTAQTSIGIGLWLSIIALILLPSVASTLARLDTYPTGIGLADLSLGTDGKELLSPDLSWTPHYPGAAWEYRVALQTENGAVVEIYGNQYHEQSQGTELISRGSHLFDPLYFSPASSDVIEIEDANGQSLPIRRDILTDSSGDSWLALYTYFVDSEPVVSSRRVQLLTAFRSMFARTTAGVVAVATPCIEGCDDRRSEIDDSLNQAIEAYRQQFRQ